VTKIQTTRCTWLSIHTAGFDVEVSGCRLVIHTALVGITEEVRRRGNYGAGDVISVGWGTLVIIQNTEAYNGKNPYWWSSLVEY
jgi:hypothetical protein